MLTYGETKRTPWLGGGPHDQRQMGGQLDGSEGITQVVELPVPGWNHQNRIEGITLDQVGRELERYWLVRRDDQQTHGVTSATG
jgi:hypothetical protein